MLFQHVAIVLTHHHTIKKFMKGVFNLRPPKNKYHSIWDNDKLLQYLQSMETYRNRGMSKKHK